MLEITLRDRIKNEEIWKRTKVEDVVATLQDKKVADDATREVSIGRAQRRWMDDIIENASTKYYLPASTYLRGLDDVRDVEGLPEIK